MKYIYKRPLYAGITERVKTMTKIIIALAVLAIAMVGFAGVVVYGHKTTVDLTSIEKKINSANTAAQAADKKAAEAAKAVQAAEAKASSATATVTCGEAKFSATGTGSQATANLDLPGCPPKAQPTKKVDVVCENGTTTAIEGDLNSAKVECKSPPPPPPPCCKVHRKPRPAMQMPLPPPQPPCCEQRSEAPLPPTDILPPAYAPRQPAQNLDVQAGVGFGIGVNPTPAPYYGQQGYGYDQPGYGVPGYGIENHAHGGCGRPGFHREGTNCVRTVEFDGPTEYDYVAQCVPGEPGPPGRISLPGGGTRTIQFRCMRGSPGRPQN